jgi:hypothetical protein
MALSDLIVTRRRLPSQWAAGTFVRFWCCFGGFDKVAVLSPSIPIVSWSDAIRQPASGCLIAIDAKRIVTRISRDADVATDGWPARYGAATQTTFDTSQTKPSQQSQSVSQWAPAWLQQIVAPHPVLPVPQIASTAQQSLSEPQGCADPVKKVAKPQSRQVFPCRSLQLCGVQHGTTPLHAAARSPQQP